MTRRRFLRAGVAAAGLLCWPRGILGAQSPAERLHVAFIGAGGRGADNLSKIVECGGRVVALCDVDAASLGAAAKTHPKATTHRDFRKMLEQKDIDAVVVSTPDHTHAIATMAAIRCGKHVYCEKPMTHSVYEARQLRLAAAEHKVATQMGNGGHSADGTRSAVEWIQSGVIGQVREVHVWTDRAKDWWLQGIQRPSDTPATPKNLDWDLWIGPAPIRPYHPAYHPFKWRGWVDFGTGALGDMGCHVFDVACWALKLTAPTTIEAESSGCNGETYPAWSIVRYEFPQRHGLPAVKLTWYDGGKRPHRPPELEEGREMGTKDGGSIFIGDKGKLIVPLGGAPRLIPEARMRDFKRPAPFIPRSIGHHKEWVEACKGGKPAGSNFEFSGPMTETILLGNVAVRLGKKIHWDSEKLKAAHNPDADCLIRREYRKGWEL